MVTPLVRVKSIKKRTKRFQRHQSDRKIAVKVRCRRAGAGRDVRWPGWLCRSARVAGLHGCCCSCCRQAAPAVVRATRDTHADRRRRCAAAAAAAPPPAGELAPAQGYRLARAPEVQGLRHHHAQHWLRHQQEDAPRAAQRCARCARACAWAGLGSAAGVPCALRPAPRRPRDGGRQGPARHGHGATGARGEQRGRWGGSWRPGSVLGAQQQQAARPGWSCGGGGGTDALGAVRRLLRHGGSAASPCRPQHAGAQLRPTGMACSLAAGSRSQHGAACGRQLRTRRSLARPAAAPPRCGASARRPTPATCMRSPPAAESRRPLRRRARRLPQVCGEQREGPGAADDAQPQVLRRDRAQRVHAQAQGHRGACVRGAAAHRRWWRRRGSGRCGGGAVARAGAWRRAASLAGVRASVSSCLGAQHCGPQQRTLCGKRAAALDAAACAVAGGRGAAAAGRRRSRAAAGRGLSAGPRALADHSAPAPSPRVHPQLNIALTNGNSRLRSQEDE